MITLEWGESWLKDSIHTLYTFCMAQIMTTSSLCTIRVMIKLEHGGSFFHGAVVTNPTGNHEVVGSIPGLAQWVKDLTLP